MQSKIPFIGRDKEINNLTDMLKRCKRDEGRVVFIEGEAGIGKTRLVEEIIEVAHEMSFRVLRARCVEGGDPYLPFANAFSDISSIEAVFLIYRDGRVLAHKTRKRDFSQDAEIVSGMLTAIQDFVKQSFRTEPKESLKEIKHGSLNIVLEHGENVFLAAIIDGPAPIGLRIQMEKALDYLEKNYGHVLKKWDGTRDSIEGIEKIPENLISSREMGIEKIRSFTMKVVSDEGYWERKREAMFSNVANLINDLCSEQPILLFIDDIHWIDASSCHLLHYIARNTKNSPFLLIATCRPEDVKDNSELMKTIREMSRERLIERFPLGRLGENHVREIISRMLGTKDVPDTFWKRVYEETKGNPFYVEELMHSLIEDSGKNVEEIYRKIEEVGVSERVEDVIMRRIEKLDKREVEVLQVSSVIGDKVDFDILSNVLPMDEWMLASALEELVKHRLMDSHLSFDHPLIRDVVYMQIPPFKKILVHKRVGNAIEKLYKKDLAKYYSSLSEHYYRGKIHSKCLKYSMLAGENALSKYAYHESMMYYKRSLEVLDDCEEIEDLERLRAEIYGKLQIIYESLGEIENSYVFCRSLISQSEILKDEKTLSEGYRHLGDLHVRTGKWDDALKSYNKSLEISTRIGDEIGAAIAYKCIGNVYFRTSSYEEAIKYHEKSREIAEKIGDDGKKTLASVYIEMGNVCTEIGEYNRALEYYEHGMHTAIEIDSLYDVATVLNNMGDVHMKMKDYEVASQYFEKSLHMFKTFGTIMDLIVVHANISECLARMGKTEDARKYLKKTEEYIGKMGDIEMPFQIHNIYGIIFRNECNWEESIKRFMTSIEILKKTSMPYYLAVTYCDIAETYRNMGEIENAIDASQKALNIFEDVGAVREAENVRLTLNSLR